MDKNEIIVALEKLLKPTNEETEDVFFNAGVIACVDAIKQL